jgi:signal transduction histidine kinase
MNIKKLLNLFNIGDSKSASGEVKEPPDTFQGELNRWCNTIVLPVSLISIVAWPIFIILDKELYGGGGSEPIIVSLRWGFTFVGLIGLAMSFIPKFKRQGYWIVMMVVAYMSLAAGVILGCVQADPVYLGGYSIVILCLALVPVKRVHALLILFASLGLFIFMLEVVSRVKSLQAASTPVVEGAWQIYGLNNLTLAITVALVAIFVFDRIRESSYQNSRANWEAHTELKKANELKNQLLQIAANDMKDPLQVIIGYTDLLKMKLQGDRFVGEKLKIVHRSTDRMIKLIAGLLEITKIESGKLVLHKAEVDLGKVVNAAFKSYQQAALKKNQKLLFDSDEDCILQGDEMMLRQVANHLISNAVKFSPPGKSIWVSVERTDIDGPVIFKVKDEGPGLEKDELEKVFNKFQQLSNKPTGGEISTGLGLAINRDLVTLHEGTITVESIPRKGCTFAVTLPVTLQIVGEDLEKIAGMSEENLV